MTKRLLDAELAEDILDLLRERLDAEEDPQIAIMHLLLCLRMLADANDVPPKEAAKHFSDAFLCIEPGPENDNHPNH
jgi:hypothetical protein